MSEYSRVAVDVNACDPDGMRRERSESQSFYSRKYSRRVRPALLALALLLPGCGGAQGAISGQAEVHVATQSIRFDWYAELDEQCGEAHDTRDAYRECMRHARSVAIAADSYRDALEVAQDAIDAGDEDRARVAIMGAIAKARTLARRLREAGVDVPPEVQALIDSGGE